MKTITSSIALLAISLAGFGQISANPGTYSWSMPSAWVGGVVPTPTQTVTIGVNSMIDLDLALIHNADINVQGGLTSANPANTLTINNANLTVSGGLNFLISGPVSVTINEGHLTNNGLFQSGDLYISYTGSTGSSATNFDFSVSGDMEIDGSELFTCNLAILVSGELFMNPTTTLVNNQYTSVGSVLNEGSILNNAYFGVTDSVENELSGTIVSSGGTFDIGANFYNDGTVDISDSMSIDGSLLNDGTFTNNGGSCGIGVDFHNTGATDGSSNGQFWVAMHSENGVAGTISDVIDICDATLAPGAHLDVDLNTAGVDFGSVTFCTLTSTAAISENFTESISIYPNPTMGYVNIEGIDNGTVEIIAADGRLMKTQSVNSAITILDLSSMPSGYYLIKLLSNEGAAIHSILKD